MSRCGDKKIERADEPRLPGRAAFHFDIGTV